LSFRYRRLGLSGIERGSLGMTLPFTSGSAHIGHDRGTTARPYLRQRTDELAALPADLEALGNTAFTVSAFLC
jgi:hypothetical protein